MKSGSSITTKIDYCQLVLAYSTASKHWSSQLKANGGGQCHACYTGYNSASLHSNRPCCPISGRERNGRYTYNGLAFCTLIYSQFTASLIPSLEAPIVNDHTIESHEENPTHPSRPDTPITSRLAIRSALEASFFHRSPAGASNECLSSGCSSVDLARSHASKDSRISATERHEGASCLFARRRRGRLRSRGELRTSSTVDASARISGQRILCGRLQWLILTKDLPCLVQTPLIACVNDKCDCVTFVVVSRPNGPDIPLSTEVEERQGCRG